MKYKFWSKIESPDENKCSKNKLLYFAHPCEQCLEPVLFDGFNHIKPLCSTCASHLPILNNVCSRCSLPLKEEVHIQTSPLCGHCQTNPPAYDYSFCIFKYASPIKFWITSLKDKRNIVWVETFANYLKMHADHVLSECEHVCIIPSKPSKLLKRGFNPTQLIADKIMPFYQAQLHDDVFLVKGAKEQRKLNLKQRVTNLKRSLHIADKNQKITGHWLILEDVITTGATANTAADLLKKQGAQRVGVCALARVIKE